MAFLKFHNLDLCHNFVFLPDNFDLVSYNYDYFLKMKTLSLLNFIL